MPSPTISTLRPRRPSLDGRTLLHRRAPGRARLDAERGGDGAHRRRVVAGQQAYVEPKARSRCNVSARPRAGSRRSGSAPAPGRGAPAKSQALRPRPLSPVAKDRLPSRISRPPASPLARMFHHALGDRDRSRGGNQRPRQRMAAGRRQRCRVAQSRRDPASLHQRQHRLGQRAGLVEHHRIDLGQPLQRGRRLQQHARAEQPTGGDHLHRGHCQRQRAGAGDDQHRARGQQRLRQRDADPDDTTTGTSAAQ